MARTCGGNATKKYRLTGAEKFTLWRRATGVSQTGAAELLGTSVYEIQRIEGGDVEVPSMHPELADLDVFERRLSRGEWIFVLRRRAGVTSRDAARMAGLTPSWYGRMEAGKVEITDEALDAVRGHVQLSEAVLPGPVPDAHEVVLREAIERPRARRGPARKA